MAFLGMRPLNSSSYNMKWSPTVVGLGELPKLIQRCSNVVGRGIGGAMIINGKPPVPTARWMRFGYADNIEPAEKLNNKSQLASSFDMDSLRNWKISVILTRMVARSTKRPHSRNATAKKPLSAWCNLAQVTQYPVSVSQNVISLGRLYPVRDFYQGVKKAVIICWNHEEYTVLSYPSLHLSCRCQSLWCLLSTSLQEENQWWILQGLS